MNPELLTRSQKTSSPTSSKKQNLAPSPHFLTGTEWPPDKIHQVIDLGIELFKERKPGLLRNTLSGRTLFLLFDKPSLRTRLSFTVAMTELGGQVIDSQGSTRKTEEPEDLARVLSRYGHGIVIRTFDHKYVERFSQASSIPVINGLTDSHHPCQVMADLMTLKQQWAQLKNLKLTYIGDGNNMLHSLMLLCPRMGIDLHYACPVGFEPSAFVVKEAKVSAKLGGGSITPHSSPISAAKNAQALYTDVWTSMGFESESNVRDQAFAGYQVNEELLKEADPKCVFMHCMPMVRGKEVSATLPDHPQSVIYQQSENRLHIQKAILLQLMGAL